jgi:hypothetical protein
MNYFDKKETDRIDRLEKKLFSKNANFDADIRSGFDKKQYEENPDWNDGDLLETNLNETLLIKKSKTGTFWIFLSIAFLFFISSLGYAAYIFIEGERVVSTDNVSIDIVGPVSVSGGNKLSIDVILQNNGLVAMKSTNFVIDYPEGTRSVDLQNELKRERIDVGDIAVGSVVKKTLDVAFLGENGEIKSIDVSAEYMTPGSIALLRKIKKFTITLSVSPVQILVKTVDRISSGQKIDFDLDIKSNSEKPINNLLVIAEYPFGFKFERASISPTYGNNVWEFKTFNPADVKNIIITGEIQAQDNEQRSFRFSAGTPKSENREEIGITLTSMRHNVLIEKPFIGLELGVGGSKESVVSVQSGKSINYNLVFSNNTNSVVRNVEARIFFEGVALNKSKVFSGTGFYDSAENKIVYAKNTGNERLSEILPRSLVDMSGAIETYDLSYNNMGLVNPEIRISAIVKGLRVSESGVTEQIEEKDFVTLKIISDPVFVSKTSYNSIYTTRAGFKDSGPVPPKVGVETTYTITWEISNSVNNLVNTKLVGVLPPYMSWVGQFGPTNEDILFDDATNRIIWNIGDVGVGVGHSVGAKYVSFQLKFRPSITQINKRPIFVDKIFFSSFDDFAKVKIEDLVGVTDSEIRYSNTTIQNDYVVQ